MTGRFLHGQFLCLLLLAGVSGCGSHDADAPPPAASLQTNPLLMRALRGVESAPVAQAFADEGQRFDVTRRTGKIGQFPCQRCHDQPLTPASEAQIDARVRGASQRWAHANIRPVHPQSADCATCHNYLDLQTLRLREGELVGMDEAYRLCAQCHFQQAQDWVGGAHGKRLAGWRGRRVIMNCTDCHDPHAPAIAPQVPLSGPRVPRTGNTH